MTFKFRESTAKLLDRCFGRNRPETAEAWARRIATSRDYRLIAAINSSDEHSEELPHWKRAAIANGILRRAGSEAVDAILEELAEERFASVDLAYVLVDIGDPKVVPLLKQKLDRGDFDAYGPPGKIRAFVDKHLDLVGEVERSVCALCGTERPVTETRGYSEDGQIKRFCKAQCWGKRGRVLKSGIGKDCPFYEQGMCIAGGGDNLCSLRAGSYISCFVYGMYG